MVTDNAGAKMQRCVRGRSCDGGRSLVGTDGSFKHTGYHLCIAYHASESRLTCLRHTLLNSIDSNSRHLSPSN